MRISDWSSDVCSSDLLGGVLRGDGAAQRNRLAIDELGFLGRLQIVGRAAADVLVRARQRADADAPRADGGREGGDRPAARGITKKAPVTRSLDRKGTRLNSSH